MTEEEKKLYVILQARFCRMAEDAAGSPSATVSSVSFFGKVFDGLDWYRLRLTWERHICHNIGVRFTSIRKNPTDNFYVQDPASQITMSKPARHIELKKDLGQKILVLGHIP